MHTYNDKEKQALIKFREKLNDLNLDEFKNADCYLIRWLRARDLDIPKAEFMLREHLKWRIENNVDDILSWEAPEIYSKFYPMELCGYDKNGCPIVIMPSKYVDMVEFLKCDQDEYLRFCTQQMEKFLQMVKEKSTLENPVTECVIIYDLDGFNFRAIMNRQYNELMQKQSKFFNDNYPELIYRAYMCYTPKVFSIMWSMFKHIMPKKTQERFQLFGYNKEKWLPVMLEHINIEDLPPRFGGTNYGFEKTCFPQFRNKDGILEGPNTANKKDEEFIAVKVPAGKKHIVDFNIDVPNTQLSWMFKTEGYDISFAVTFESKEEIVPNSRVDSATKKQIGHIDCEKVGRYSLEFDNTYSRMRAKTLHYFANIENLITDLEISNCNGDSPQTISV